MTKRFAVINVSKKEFIQDFDFAEQANKFIKKRFGGSPFLVIKDRRKNSDI